MSQEREYEFLFVVDGVSIDDDEAVTVLTDAFDGVLSWNRGLYRLAVSGLGCDGREAAATLMSRLAAALPGLRVVRLDPADWPSNRQLLVLVHSGSQPQAIPFPGTAGLH